MITCYKAVRPDGCSFHDPSFRWVPAEGDPTGTIVRHPDYEPTGMAARYLSVATVPTDCTGMSWPCRLLTVEPVEGDVLPDPSGEYHHKRIGAAFVVTGERPAYEALGPQGEQVVAFLALLTTLTSEQWAWAAWAASWDATRAAAWDATWAAAWAAAWAATWVAAWDAAWVAAGDAALALVVRDLITRNQFATLTAPMCAAGIDFDTLGGSL